MEPSETSSRIHVGRAALEGNIARYAKAFDLLEVAAERGRHPRRPGLLEWRRAVGEHFVFTAVVPASLSSLEVRPDAAELLAHARLVADALGASWWLLRTPPTVTPSARAARELEALVGGLRDAGRRIAWEPRGLWADEGALRLAAQLGVHLVRDLAREDRLDDDDVAYTRLRALGEGARIGAAAAERVAERLAEVSDAYVVVEGAGAGRVRQVLREMAGIPADGAEAPDDDLVDDDLVDDGATEEDPGSPEEGQ